MAKELVTSPAIAVGLVMATASDARAWGACHVGYTHVGYGGGVNHAGRRDQPANPLRR